MLVKMRVLEYLCLFREIADIFVNSVEFVFALIDGVVAAIVAAVLAVRSGICFTFASVASAASSAASAAADAGTAVGGFVIHPILSLRFMVSKSNECAFIDVEDKVVRVQIREGFSQI